MPRDGAIIFSDLIGKLDDLRVSCDKCERFGRYPVQSLIRDRGRETKIVDWLDQITADCDMCSAVVHVCFGPIADILHDLWRRTYSS